MNHVLFAVPVLNRYDLLNCLLISLTKSELAPDQIMVIDNGNQKEEIYIPFDLRERTTIVSPGRNVGTAGAWNYALYASKDFLILSNDDIEVFPNTLPLLVGAAMQHPDKLMFVPESGTGCAFSFCLFRRKVLDVVGAFDPLFWPYYFEDNDYVYRMKLAGVHNEFCVRGCNYHHVGSATLRAKNEEEQQEHHRQFRALKKYYLMKWGGPPLSEEYDTPFGLDQIP